jgi:hypothetical protein
LSRASTSYGAGCEEDADGRAKPGHDGGEGARVKLAMIALARKIPVTANAVVRTDTAFQP